MANHTSQGNQGSMSHNGGPSTHPKEGHDGSGSFGRFGFRATPDTRLIKRHSHSKCVPMPPFRFSPPFNRISPITLSRGTSHAASRVATRRSAANALSAELRPVSSVRWEGRRWRIATGDPIQGTKGFPAQHLRQMTCKKRHDGRGGEECSSPVR